MIYTTFGAHICVCLLKMSCKPEPDSLRLQIKTDIFIATTHDNDNVTYIFLTIG